MFDDCKDIKKKKPNCYCYIMGPTGPAGPPGPATIKIGTTTTTNSGSKAEVSNSGTDENVTLNFKIPMGPTGPSGEGETITIRNTITGDPNTSAKVIDTVQDKKHILDFVIPRGEKGDDGPNRIRAAYLVTFNDGTSADGIPVPSTDNIPIDRVELDVSNLITLNTENDTIKFNNPGYYKVSFSISAYPTVNGPDFDPTTDIVAVGIREENTDNVYIGVSQWVYNAEPVQLTAEGILSIIDTRKNYELANLGKSTIFLETPSLTNIASKSYFINSLVTIMIEYLGRQ